MHRLLFVVVFCLQATFLPAKRPDITIVCVVDQLAEHLLTRHRPYLRGGLKKLLENGRVYTNAYFPHALPATATGHAALSTGALPNVHGLIANEWYEGKKRIKACDEKDIVGARVFGKRNRAKSARSLEAPTFSSACILNEEPFSSIAISLKSRAAIPTAGPHGTAVWFNSKDGLFTSSKAFGPRLPEWARTINDDLLKTVHHQTHTMWRSQFDEGHEAYQHVHDNRYLYTGYPHGLVNNPQPLRSGRKPFFLFEQTPQANQTLLRMARLALRLKRQKDPNQPIILWLSLSGLDYVGHYFGPHSKEAIDMVYHLDEQLGHFISRTEEEHGADNCLWALTADHGVMPIPEHSYASGRLTAQRLDAHALMKDLNKAIYDSFNVKNLIHALLTPNLYLDDNKWDDLASEMQDDIVAFIKNYLTAITGITHAWYRDDFNKDFIKEYGVHGREHWFKKQFYPKRSGDFVVRVAPYTYLTSYPKGTSHDSPHDYDVRVPLMLYGPSRITAGTYNRPVSMLQLPTTLATLLGVDRPARAPRHGLPL